jgi:PST family polysaccharide transporter
MTIAKKAISGALWMSGINYIGFGINFAVQLFLVRLLVPEDFGLFVLGFSIAEILFIFFSFSFSMGVIQIQDAEYLLDTAFYLSLFSGLIILIIGGIISLFISPYYPLKSIIAFFILCALQPFNGCASIYSASMEKELRFKRNAIVRGISSNFSGIVAIYLAHLGFGVWTLIGREIITSILFLLGMRMLSSYRFGKHFSKDSAIKLLNFGYKRFFLRGLEIVYHRVPMFFIGTFLGTRLLGLFSQSYYLVNLPNTILGPVHQNVGFATYSKIQNDKKRLSNGLYITNYFFIRFLMPLMLILFLFPKEVLYILYGNKWIDASPIIRYFSVYAALLTLLSNGNTLASSLGRLIEAGKSYIPGIVIVFVGVIIAINYKELYLIALAYSISILINLIVIMYFLKKEEIILNFKKLFITPVIGCILIITLYFLISNLFINIIVANRSLNVIYITMIYLLFTFIFFLLEPSVAIRNLKYIQKKWAG